MVQPQEQESLGDSPWHVPGAWNRHATVFRAIARNGRPNRCCRCRFPWRSAGRRARGGSIGKRVGRKLGWQVYNQEVMEYIAQDGLSSTTAAELTPAAAQWAEQRGKRLCGIAI